MDLKIEQRKAMLSEALRQARKAAGLSRDAAARALGIYPTELTRYERGTRVAGIPFFRLEGLAVLYGKKLEDFATWTEDLPDGVALRWAGKRLAREASRRRSKEVSADS